MSYRATALAHEGEGSSIGGMQQVQSLKLPFDPDAVLHVDSINLDLLAGKHDALQRRIECAAGSADSVRRLIQSHAERRSARSKSGVDYTVKLLAWPMMVTVSGERHVQIRQEPALFSIGQPAHAEIARRIRALWGSLLAGSGAAEVLPLPRVVHLNAVLAGDPTRAHRCVFSGASILEGRRASEFFFTWPDNRNLESLGGPVAAPYLSLAFVATPQAKADPVPRMTADAKLAAQQLFSAMLSVNGVSPQVTMLRPMGFFGALDCLQLEQIWHFVEWTARRGLDPRLDISEEIEPCGKKWRVGASCSACAEVPEGLSCEWVYDSIWRPHDSLRDIQAEVASRLSKLRSANYDGNVGKSASSTQILH